LARFLFQLELVTRPVAKSYPQGRASCDPPPPQGMPPSDPDRLADVIGAQGRPQRGFPGCRRNPTAVFAVVTLDACRFGGSPAQRWALLPCLEKVEVMDLP
jgi:hypothetical protein